MNYTILIVYKLLNIIRNIYTESNVKSNQINTEEGFNARH